MRLTPVLGFAAYSGIGKTTLIERIVRELRKEGLRVAVIKHDGHDYDIDHRGKDSWRYTQAGAEITVVSSSFKTAFMENRPMSLPQILSRIREVDIVLVEGYKNEEITQIGMARRGNAAGFPAPLSRYAAIVTDMEDPDTPLPVFSFEEVCEIARFIMDNRHHFTHFSEEGQIKNIQVNDLVLEKKGLIPRQT